MRKVSLRRAKNFVVYGLALYGAMKLLGGCAMEASANTIVQDPHVHSIDSLLETAQDDYLVQEKDITFSLKENYQAGR